MDMSVFKKFEVKYSSEEMIICEFEPGNEFYLIQKGSVRVVKVMNGIEKTLDVLLSGEFFGEMAILENVPRSASIIAQEDCVLLKFNKSNFELLMKGQPQVAYNLLKVLSKRIFDQRRRIITLNLSDINIKIYDVLIMLIEKQIGYGILKPNTVIKTTLKDIAHWAGLSERDSQTVLDDLVTRNKIEVHKNDILIRKPDSIKWSIDQYRNK